AAVLFALVAGVFGTSLALVEAWRQQDLKEQARKDAQTNAETARGETAKAKVEWDRAEWLLYASQITLAQRAWEDGNAALAFHYLDSCRKDFRGWEHDYLFTLFNSDRHRTLRGHTYAVNSLALSPDGKRIVSGGGDKTVKVWDVTTGQVIRTLTGHTGVI